MGSLRNPIGPLPSSIYWRRRGVALLLFVLLLILVIWAFSLGGSGGGGKGDDAKGPGGKGIESTITPGPSATSSVNSQRPGGRDESGEDGGSGGSGSGGGDASGGGSGGSGGDDSGTGGGGGSGGGGGGADALGVGNGVALADDSSLPDCSRDDIELTLRSVLDSREKNTYAPDEKPTFEVIVKNTSDSACKVDFGRASASLTITDKENEHVWASNDCSRGSALALIEVPADGETTRTVQWDRTLSSEECATPSGGGTAKSGTYLVEARVDGLGSAQVSFVLEQD
ncbi:hypothetical protein [Streptomyces sp. SAJ15]|uniref:hypothetical protein n=1 Tax=Streptomyces sp. SAJ15 TaxID=2011095 RepID=UPI0011865D55|nr:hypothetical protein [Streptomyces sp. SAJ15]TVL92113.1 hypothetical protein CD790_10200 [Streptomyces sp. SAJ15]